MDEQYRLKIEQLYLKLYPLLFEYARSSLSRNALAEEAVQEAFQIACRKPEALFHSPNPEGWMVNTLKNVLRNTLRDQDSAKKALIAYLVANPKDIEASNNELGVELLYEDIAKLEEFQLIKAMVLDKKSYLELSKELGISVAACRKRVQRAKELLQKKIKN